MTFCEDLERLGIKVKESADSMEKIPYKMVLHKHIDREDTRFYTMSGTLANNPLGKRLGVIRRCTYKEYAKDRRWSYEPVSYL